MLDSYLLTMFLTSSILTLIESIRGNASPLVGYILFLPVFGRAFGLI